MKSYPFVVIGAGAAGLVVSIGVAKAGKRVLLIEKGLYGGDCTNYGCIPSKTLIGCAKRREDGRESLWKVRRVVSDVRLHEDAAALRALGVETLTATVSFASPHCLEAKEENGQIHQIEAQKIVIATGSAPEIPSIPGLSETPFLTNETIFNLESIPKSLIVLGGGPIGCELAQAFQRLGALVHLVHRHSELLRREPKDVSYVLIEKFRKEGIQLYLEDEVERIQYRLDHFQVHLKKTKKILEGEKLLVAVGRKPQLKELCLEKAQVAFTHQGISVDAYGRTSQKHIFAIGDVIGPPFFTHRAENQARCVLTTLLLSPILKKKINQQAIPRVTYTDPEVASFGLLEEEAIEKYGKRNIAVYRISMSQVDRAVTQGKTEGFIQVVTKRLSSRILGAIIVCPRAGEMINELSLAMHAHIPLRKLAELIHPYPTYSLAIRKAADLWLSETFLPLFKKIGKK